MKKLAVAIITIASFACAPASAQHHHHGGYHHHTGGNWIAPLVGGAILGAIIARPPVYAQPPVVVQQPPVIIQQPPVVVEQAPFYGPAFRDYYNCLVQVYDPYSGQYRNEVRTCVR
jgi:hypothetical protein